MYVYTYVYIYIYTYVYVCTDGVVCGLRFGVWGLGLMPSMTCSGLFPNGFRSTEAIMLEMRCFSRTAPIENPAMNRSTVGSKNCAHISFAACGGLYGTNWARMHAASSAAQAICLPQPSYFLGIQPRVKSLRSSYTGLYPLIPGRGCMRRRAPRRPSACLNPHTFWGYNPV